MRERLRCSGRSAETPVQRFETVQGCRPDGLFALRHRFTAEGRRRVHVFSYILAYSRRQYVRFVEAQDFATTMREHVRAFEYFRRLGRHLSVRQHESGGDRL